MEEKEKPRLIKCPECPVKLPENSLRALIDHMEANHPETIARHLREIGLPHLAERFSKKKK
jgi:hypothetical protein